MRILNEIVDKVNVAGSDPLYTSAVATNNDDKPPKPLNSATNCGMDVISTLLAKRAPTAPPTIKPTMINS